MSARQMLEDIAKKKMEINTFRGEKVFHIAKKKDTIRKASQSRLIKGARVPLPEPPSVKGVFEAILGRSTISHQRLRTMSVAIQVGAMMKMAKMRADIVSTKTLLDIHERRSRQLELAQRLFEKDPEKFFDMIKH